MLDRTTVELAIYMCRYLTGTQDLSSFFRRGEFSTNVLTLWLYLLHTGHHGWAPRTTPIWDNHMKPSMYRCTARWSRFRRAFACQVACPELWTMECATLMNVTKWFQTPQSRVPCVLNTVESKKIVFPPRGVLLFLLEDAKSKSSSTLAASRSSVPPIILLRHQFKLPFEVR